MYCKRRAKVEVTDSACATSACDARLAGCESSGPVAPISEQRCSVAAQLPNRVCAWIVGIPAAGPGEIHGDRGFRGVSLASQERAHGGHSAGRLCAEILVRDLEIARLAQRLARIARDARDLEIPRVS